MNEDNRLHYRARAELRAEWKAAFWGLAKQARIPKGLPHIEVFVTHHYRANVPDCDACAPAVKAAIDGIALAGVVQNDGPKWVGPITYQLPHKALRPALELLLVVAVPTPVF